MKDLEDKIDEILNRIVSQEAITEGGYAEYALNDDDIKYGNPLHHQPELKQALLALFKDSQNKLLAERRNEVLEDLLKELPEKKNTDAGHTSKSIESGWMASGYNQALKEVTDLINSKLGANDDKNN